VLHGLLRLPKPTYLKGLTFTAEKLVAERVKALGVKKHSFDVGIPVRPISTPIVLKDLALSVVSRVNQTRKSLAVQEAFGIKPEHLDYPVICNLSIEVKPKSTLLIVGPSGSGKTMLLSAIAGKLQGLRRVPGSRIRIEGSVISPSNMKVGTLKNVRSEKSIIELFGGKDIRRAIYVLNMAGLSEAYLYLKRFHELSAGQQYRAMIAKMVDAERNVWIADEFCSTLDPITAHMVAQNLKRLSEKFGATLVVAAPHWAYFLQALRPDKVVYLMSGREHRVFEGLEFLRISRRFNC
jgi:ABC-type ATPase with predicted acetyltransferase domain